MRADKNIAGEFLPPDPHMLFLAALEMKGGAKGELDLGGWERIFYDEFDGRRGKRVLMRIIGE